MKPISQHSPLPNLKHPFARSTIPSDFPVGKLFNLAFVQGPASLQIRHPALERGRTMRCPFQAFFAIGSRLMLFSHNARPRRTRFSASPAYHHPMCGIVPSAISSNSPLSTLVQGTTAFQFATLVQVPFVFRYTLSIRASSAFSFHNTVVASLAFRSTLPVRASPVLQFKHPSKPSVVFRSPRLLLITIPSITSAIPSGLF